MEGGRVVFLDAPAVSRGLPALARALASSPVWAKFARAALVVRGGATPRLAIAGVFDAADAARLRNLHKRLQHDLPRLRHVSYEQAQADCLTLARALQDRFGAAARDRFHYMAIPRGGHIVLGMLAYALDLRAAQLAPPPSPDTPLVVVDDCALSGARLKGLLPGLAGEALVFAPLYSPAGLRRAITAQEPRVIDCLSAQDLEDDAPAQLGEKHAAWQAFERKIRGDIGYWYGRCAPLGFAWNEPDSGFWNPAVEAREKEWNLLPPEACLKTQIGWDAGAGARIQVNADGPGPIQAAEGVVYAEIDGTLLIGDAATGQTHALDGVGADIWRALLATGTTEAARARLGADYDVDEATLTREVAAFTETLVTAGLLMQGRARGTPPSGAGTSRGSGSPRPSGQRS